MSREFTLADLTKVDWYAWMHECAYLPTKEKYSFDGFEYLKDIVKIPWKPGDQRYLSKSAQCGGSELLIDWELWLAERNLPNFNGMGYLFPAKTLLNDHIKARIIPILEVDRFRRKLKGACLGFIRYNNIPWYFRSGNSRALKGWRADAIVVDEFDEYEDPISIISKVEARLNASKYQWIYGLSTPTYPDIGIDKAITLCSQYNWHVRCQKCHKEFSPLNEVKISSFENCVVRGEKDGVGFVCPHCKDITQTNERGGRWRQDTSTSKNKIAHLISRLFLDQTTLEELLNKFEEALNLQEFYNSDLGLPYSPPNSRLSRHDITDLALGEMECYKAYGKASWAGIDVGKKCHYVIGIPNENGIKKIICYGECSFEQLKGILKRFSVKYLVIDLRPYEQEVKKILRGNRKFFACDFNTGNQEDWYRLIKVDSETTDKTVRIVKADRTQSCDNLIEQIATRKGYIFPGKAKGDTSFISQMCAPMRMDKTDKLTGDLKSYYQSASKKDHYFFACAFLNLAFNLKKSSVAKLGGLFY